MVPTVSGRFRPFLAVPNHFRPSPMRSEGTIGAWLWGGTQAAVPTANMGSGLQRPQVVPQPLPERAHVAAPSSAETERLSPVSHQTSGYKGYLFCMFVYFHDRVAKCFAKKQISGKDAGFLESPGGLDTKKRLQTFWGPPPYASRRLASLPFYVDGTVGRTHPTIVPHFACDNLHFLLYFLVGTFVPIGVGLV